MHTVSMYDASRRNKAVSDASCVECDLEGGAMLEMRATCEKCEVDLPADAPDAVICSFECTFCRSCAGQMGERCPNCNGELVSRPRRTA